jgi:4-amino-4-deoxy-L-arabinose transferase-like glycosyltransferase
VGLDAPPRNDAAQFHAIAQSVAEGGPYVTGEGLRSRRAPGYSFVLAGIYRLFGPLWPAARAGQALIGAAVCPILLILGSRCFGSATGILAALCYALFPYSVYWTGDLISEPLVTLLVTASTWALIGAREDWRRVAAWAFLCGLSTLTRPNMGILFLASLVWLLLGRRRGVARCAAAVVVFAATLAPWTVRNYRVHHSFMPVTALGGVVLWEANNPYVLRDAGRAGWALHAPDLPEARLVEGLSEAEVDAFYFRLALHTMREHWRSMPVLIARKFLRLWNPWPRLESRWLSLIACLSLTPVLVLLAAGLVTTCIRRDRNVTPLLLPILAVIVTAVIYWADARIRAPADPMIVLVASYGAVSMAGWLRRAGGRGPAAGAPAAGPAALL